METVSEVIGSGVELGVGSCMIGSCPRRTTTRWRWDGIPAKASELWGLHGFRAGAFEPGSQVHRSGATKTGEVFALNSTARELESTTSEIDPMTNLQDPCAMIRGLETPNAPLVLRRAVLVAGLLLLLAKGLVVAQATESQTSVPAEEQEAPSLTLESIEVEPTRPGREVLCRLSVRISNGGEAAASVFGFEVKVEGEALEVYRDQRYLQIIPAGETAEIELFNFWSGDSRRAAPSDGRLDVEVALTTATWVTQRMEEGVEVTTLGTPIEGLPVRSTKSVTLSK